MHGFYVVHGFGVVAAILMEFSIDMSAVSRKGATPLVERVCLQLKPVCFRLFPAYTKKIIMNHVGTESSSICKLTQLSIYVR